MSLDYKLTDIDQWEELVTDGQLNPVTQALVFNAMAIGIGTITEESIEEVYIRTTMADAVYGPPLVGPAPDHRTTALTLADIRRHIGLWTNVFPMETAAKFDRRMAGALRRNAVERYQRESK